MSEVKTQKKRLKAWSSKDGQKSLSFTENDLLYTEAGKKFGVPFHVGAGKTVIYGIPMHLEHRSDMFKEEYKVKEYSTLLDSLKTPLHLFTTNADFADSKIPTSFKIVWNYLNGFGDMVKIGTFSGLSLFPKDMVELRDRYATLRYARYFQIDEKSKFYRAYLEQLVDDIIGPRTKLTSDELKKWIFDAAILSKESPGFLRILSDELTDPAERTKMFYGSPHPSIAEKKDVKELYWGKEGDCRENLAKLFSPNTSNDRTKKIWIQAYKYIENESWNTSLGVFEIIDIRFESVQQITKIENRAYINAYLKTMNQVNYVSLQMFTESSPADITGCEILRYHLYGGTKGNTKMYLVLTLSSGEKIYECPHKEYWLAPFLKCHGHKSEMVWEKPSMKKIKSKCAYLRFFVFD